MENVQEGEYEYKGGYEGGRETRGKGSKEGGWVLGGQCGGCDGDTVGGECVRQGGRADEKSIVTLVLLCRQVSLFGLKYECVFLIYLSNMRTRGECCEQIKSYRKAK